VLALFFLLAYTASARNKFFFSDIALSWAGVEQRMPQILFVGQEKKANVSTMKNTYC
jgi:hypothetical protein